MSSMSVCMHPSIMASHICCGHTGGRGWPLVQLAAVTCFTYCGHAGQSLLPILLRAQAAAAVVPLVGGTGIQASCLYLASATTAGTLSGNVFCLCRQQISLAAETVGVLVCEVIFPTLTLGWYQSWPGCLSHVVWQELFVMDSC